MKTPAGWSTDAADLAFRYGLISPLLDPALSRAEKAAYRRGILARSHHHPTRGLVTVSARSIRRWIREYRIHAQCGLSRRLRKDRGSRVLQPAHLQLAVSLLKENPRRDTAFVIAEMEHAFPELEGRVKRSTLNRHLHALGVRRRALPEETSAGPPYRSFEATAPNELWHSDCHHGPPALAPDGKVLPTRIFAWLDDHSRTVCHCEAYFDESLPCLEDCLKKAMLKFGVPRRVYTDRGSVYSGTQFALICSDLGIYPVPTTAYSPWKHGKIERLWGVQEDQIWSEIALLPPLPLEKVNRYLQGWVEAEHHAREHSSTGQRPLERWGKNRPSVVYPTNEQLERLFWLWQRRKVTTTGVVKLCGNEYHVDPMLAGRNVIARYDPFDLRQIQVWSNEKMPRSLGEGRPDVLLVRSHTAPPPPPDRLKLSPAAQRRLDALEKRLKDHLDKALGLIRYEAPQGE